MKLPLLIDLPDDHAVAFHRHGVITVGEFRHDVARLVAQLPEHKYVLNDCDDRYQFLVGFAAAMVRGQISLFPGNRVPNVWSRLSEDYPGVYCLTDQDDVPEVLPLLRFLRKERSGTWARPVPELAFPPSQLAAVAFTSGSTGRPKPFAKYWRGWVHEGRAGGICFGMDSAKRGAVVATVPPQHMYGFVASVLLPLRFGYAMCCERPFFPEDIRAALEMSPYKPILVTTPVQLRACVMEKTKLPPLDFILSSAAPLPRAVAEEAEQLFDTRVYEYYGSTETGAMAYRRQLETEVWHTFEGARVRPHPDGFLAEADHFDPVALNDVVEILNERQFKLVGRNSDLVKIGGKRTSLIYLNQQLQEIPGVADGAFLLEEAQEGREPRLTAFVVAPGQAREAIQAALRARVDEVFLPRRLWLVSALPRNATGKLPRQNMLHLRDELERQGS